MKFLLALSFLLCGPVALAATNAVSCGDGTSVDGSRGCQVVSEIKAMCSAETLAKDCRLQAVGSECIARGPLGGKMPGECQQFDGEERCGCFPKF